MTRPFAAQPSFVAAFGYMMLALVSFSLVAIAGREASKGVATSELIFLRNLIGAVILSALLWVKGWRFADMRTSVLPLHLVRNGIHFGAQYSWLYALTLMPLAELFAIEFTAPLWVAVVAPFVLGERLTAGRVLAASLGFIGALVVAQPGILGDSFQMSFSIGAQFALMAALGFAFSMVSTKFLTRTEPVFRILFIMHVVQTIIGAFLLPHGFPVPPPVIMFWVLVVALAGLTAHYGLAAAFARADAMMVAPLDFIRLPLIAVLGAWIYGETLGTGVAIGAGIVVIGNLVNLWSERRTRMRAAKNVI
ncbi:MAG: DMT family transporter [Hyphomicrobiaceae bacterium]|nr:DMT family transporter [Hyphomicrobiaceae bacterium]